MYFFSFFFLLSFASFLERAVVCYRITYATCRKSWTTNEFELETDGFRKKKVLRSRTPMRPARLRHKLSIMEERCAIRSNALVWTAFLWVMILISVRNSNVLILSSMNCTFEFSEIPYNFHIFFLSLGNWFCRFPWLWEYSTDSHL